jgi:hypothetical protein
MQDSLAAAGCFKVLLMRGSTHVSTWVSADTKRRFAAIAHQEGLSESALLRRMINLLLQSTSAREPVDLKMPASVIRGARLTIRLPSDDRLLLQERAGARGLPGATYVAVLIRAHLRALTPLPQQELLALKRSVSELGTIGRNLNQIASACNQGARSAVPGREDLRAVLRACEGLRDHVKALIKANLASWSSGHAVTED